ncbi:MAG: hypothetical protein H0T46_17150 [Deltaproteobacteria bacterium]|nr:hypothetical protein [Deltaproteobacteria bacterium]
MYGPFVEDLDATAREAMLLSRANIVLAQLTMLTIAAPELPIGGKPFGDGFAGVPALCAHLMPRIERILVGLGHLGHTSVGSASYTAVAALRRVAIGNAEFGFALLSADAALVDALAIGSAMPSRRFALGCRTLRIALGAVADLGLARPASALADTGGTS